MPIYSDTLNWSDITPICELITELDLITNFNPPYFEAEYCLFCGRRRVAVARYRMICLVLVNSHLFPLPCGAGSAVPREGFDLSVMSGNVWNPPSGSFMVDMGISSNIMKYPSPKCFMTFWDMPIYSDTLNWSDITPICELITELDLITNFNPPYFEAEYCLFCGRRRVAVARYRMICLVLVNSHLFPLPCGAGSAVPREGFDLSVIILASLLVFPMLGCRHFLLRL